MRNTSSVTASKMPVSLPTVIALHGPPGAGKSPLARALSRHLVWPLLDKDDLKDLLDGQTPHAGALSHELLLRLVDRQLRQGVSVVCDSPLLEQTYTGLATLVAATEAQLRVVTCACSDGDVWRQRIAARQDMGLAAHHTTTWEAVARGSWPSPGSTTPSLIRTCASIRLSPSRVSCPRSWPGSTSWKVVENRNGRRLRRQDRLDTIPSLP